MALSLRSRLSLGLVNQAMAVPRRAIIRAATARSITTTIQCKEATNLEEFPDLRVICSMILKTSEADIEFQESAPRRDGQASSSNRQSRRQVWREE